MACWSNIQFNTVVVESYLSAKSIDIVVQISIKTLTITKGIDNFSLICSALQRSREEHTNGAWKFTMGKSNFPIFSFIFGIFLQFQCLLCVLWDERVEMSFKSRFLPLVTRKYFISMMGSDESYCCLSGKKLL